MKKWHKFYVDIIHTFLFAQPHSSFSTTVAKPMYICMFGRILSRIDCFIFLNCVRSRVFYLIRIIVSNPDRCIRSGSLCPIRISVSDPDHCDRSGSLCPIQIIVSDPGQWARDFFHCFFVVFSSFLIASRQVPHGQVPGHWKLVLSGTCTGGCCLLPGN